MKSLIDRVTIANIVKTIDGEDHDHVEFEFKNWTPYMDVKALSGGAILEMRNIKIEASKPFIFATNIGSLKKALDVTDEPKLKFWSDGTISGLVAERRVKLPIVISPWECDDVMEEEKEIGSPLSFNSYGHELDRAYRSLARVIVDWPEHERKNARVKIARDGDKLAASVIDFFFKSNEHGKVTIETTNVEGEEKMILPLRALRWLGKYHYDQVKIKGHEYSGMGFTQQKLKVCW